MHLDAAAPEVVRVLGGNLVGACAAALLLYEQEHGLRAGPAPSATVSSGGGCAGSRGRC